MMACYPLTKRLFNEFNINSFNMTSLGIHTLGLVSLRSKPSLIKDGFGILRWFSLRVYKDDEDQALNMSQPLYNSLKSFFLFLNNYFNKYNISTRGAKLYASLVRLTYMYDGSRFTNISIKQFITDVLKDALCPDAPKPCFL